MFLEEARKIRKLVDDIEIADNWIKTFEKKTIVGIDYQDGKKIGHVCITDDEVRNDFKQAAVNYYQERRSKAVDELDRIGR